MVINKILKQLTPERIKAENEAILRTKLPPEIQKWVKEYEEVGERNEYIWKWLYKMNVVSPFLEIPKKYNSNLLYIKILLNMYIILLDDVSEKNKETLLNELLKIPFYKKFLSFTNFSKKESRYLKFTLKVWQEIEKNIKRYPNYKKFRDIFYFDVWQFLSEVRYSYLVFRKPYWMNEMEYWVYLPFGMQIVLDFDLDLMCSSKKIDIFKLGKTREIILTLQKMGRIGNWVSTWERETKKADFTCAIFPYALSHNLVKFGELEEKKKDNLITKLLTSNTEEYLLREWEKYYQKIKNNNKKIQLLNLKKILKNFQILIFMHLISRGYK